MKRLQYAYGHYVELGLWNDFADLFADDAVTNYQQGVRGKDAVRRLFFEQVGQGKLGLAEGRIYPHILFQPVITLAPDGRTAKGRWRILAMLGGLGGSATWYSGVYENEYVLEDGVWKISVIHSEPKVTAAYSAAGWKESGVHVPFHFTAASVGAPIPDTVRRNATAAKASLSDRVNQLARRVTRLKDQAEVTNLQDTYGYAVDRKQWDQAAGLFASDGTMELGLQGVYAGKASIRHALDQFGQGLANGELNDHVCLQTLVSVAPDGRTANARGVELIMLSGPGGVNGELREGTFENTFVKQDSVWKIQSVRFYPRMIVDAAAGWAKSAKPAPGPSQDFPPDRPPTASYAIYPKFAVAPFHFDNPVTGKPPQYPEGVPSSPRPTTAVAATPSRPPIRSAAELAARLEDAERGIAAAGAYDAAENLLGAVRLLPGRIARRRGQPVSGEGCDSLLSARGDDLREPDPATCHRRRAGRPERYGACTHARSRRRFGRHRLLVGRHVRRPDRFGTRKVEIPDSGFLFAVVRPLSRWLGSAVAMNIISKGILAVLTSTAAFAQQKVDTVVTNGKILTVDADFRVVEALAINDGRIVARGTSAEMARYAGPNTKVIDVKGATVIPGLIDNHFHFTRGVETLAPAGPLRRRRLAPRSAADSRGQGREPEARRLDHGAGRLDAATVRRCTGRLHARGAGRRCAEESAVRAGRL